jgi:hypothetical protein
LRWANGLAGKLERLLIPLSAASDNEQTVRDLRPASQQINTMRNRVVHQGEFCNDQQAKATIEEARQFIITLVRLHEAAFELESKKGKTRRQSSANAAAQIV